MSCGANAVEHGAMASLPQVRQQASLPVFIAFVTLPLRHLLIETVVIALLFAVNSAASGDSLPALRQLAKKAQVSALVVNLNSMQTIAAINPGERLTPASVSKLFTTAAALQQFGPNHRFVTRLATTGSAKNGTLHGNLNLIGSGDPMLNVEDLHHLAQRLRARGIRQVTGNLVINASHFGRVPCQTPDRCHARTKSSHAYNAPLSAVGLDYGTLHATVYPGRRAGTSTRVVLHPIGLAGYQVDNRSRTHSAASHPALRAWRTTGKHQTVLHIRGQLPVGGKPVELFRSVAKPGRETAYAMNRILADAGVHVQGVAQVTRQRTQATQTGAITLARIKSRTLAAQLIPMLAYSNNYMADTLTLDIAAAKGMRPPLTLPEAAQPLENLGRRVRRQIFGAAAGQSAPTFASGSGLSTRNQISARDLVALLAAMYRNSALFPAFYGALPVPRYAPGKMLKHAGPAFLNRLTAKTGTLHDPVSARSLAGYMRNQNHGFVAYAVLINGTTNHPHPGFHNTVGAYESDLERLLAQH